MRRQTGTPCAHCGSHHPNVPTEGLNRRVSLGLGVDCPHCGEWHGFDATDPSELETHPSVPDDEPLTCVCHECNGSFRVKVE